MMNKPAIDRFWENVVVNGEDDCWLWKGSINSSGYGQMSIGNRMYRANRLAYSFANPWWNGEGLILHSCHCRSCVNPRHLRVGTAKENSRDMIVAKRGGHQKLSLDDATEIRRLRAEGMSRKDIAERFGVSTCRISSITTNATLIDEHYHSTKPIPRGYSISRSRNRFMLVMNRNNKFVGRFATRQEAEAKAKEILQCQTG